MQQCRAYTECDRCFRSGSNKSNQCVELDDMDIDRLEQVAPIRICRQCLQEIPDFTDDHGEASTIPKETTDAR